MGRAERFALIQRILDLTIRVSAIIQFTVGKRARNQCLKLHKKNDKKCGKLLLMQCTIDGALFVSKFKFSELEGGG